MKNTSKTTIVFSTQKRLVVSFAMLAIFLFGLVGNCSAYVTPDWAAQERANKRQQPRTLPVVVNLNKELKNNKRQQIKYTKYNKLSNKKSSARQKAKGKPYKYDRKAELRRNAKQEVK